MAHIVASITVFVNAPLSKERHCKRKDCPDALFMPREWRPAGHVFWHLHVLPPIEVALAQIEMGRLLIEQIQATVFSNPDLFVTDMHGQKTAGGC